MDFMSPGYVIIFFHFTGLEPATTNFFYDPDWMIFFARQLDLP